MGRPVDLFRDFRVHAGLAQALPSLNEAKKKSEFAALGQYAKEADYLDSRTRDLARATQSWSAGIAMAKAEHGKMALYRVAKDKIHDAGSELSKALETAHTAAATSRPKIAALTKPGVGSNQEQAKLVIAQFDGALEAATKARAGFSAMTKATTAKGPDAFWQWLADV